MWKSMRKIRNLVWWEAPTEEERKQQFDRLSVEDSPEEKQKMANIRNDLENDIAENKNHLK